MKKILISTLMLICAITFVQSQSLKEFFEKYQDDERLEYVNLSNGIFNMIPQIMGAENDDLKKMSKLNNMKILSAEGAANASLGEKMEKELQQIIRNGNFQKDLEARDKGEKAYIYHRLNGKDNADMLIVSKEKEEFSVIWITGKMTKEEIQKAFPE